MYIETNRENCGDKRTFASFKEASGYNKRSARFTRGNKRHEKMHVYRCYACRQWHIGHPKHKPRRKRERVEIPSTDY